jgi:hypothetical protein
MISFAVVEDLFDEEDWIRGPNIGKKLDKLTRSRKGKLPLVIEPGKTRPSSVMIAAKFATECHIAVRHCILIFPHWKEYKKESSAAIIKAFRDRVCVSVQNLSLHCLLLTITLSIQYQVLIMLLIADQV